MKYIIFGTGKYWIKFSPYICKDDVVCFADNDRSKADGEICGIPIVSVENILNKKYDYILILVKNYTEIVKQLLELNISKEKIVSYDELYDIGIIPKEMVVSKGNLIELNRWKENENKKNILIFCHVLSRSGVPVALMWLAILLKKMGYHILMTALDGGVLESELKEHEIDYISNMQGIYKSKKFLDQIQDFDLIILGTIVLHEVGLVFSGLNVPIMWWIHESLDFFYEHSLPSNYGNIYYYGGGKRVLSKFQAYYPEETIQELLYYLPNIMTTPKIFTKKRRFALIGVFEERKAQDIFVKAIKLLSIDVRQKCDFYFVGVADSERRKIMEQLCKEYEQIHYVYQMNQRELAAFYRQIDILVCPSRDDPMPIVVTQALQNGIPCIISDQVGQSEYIESVGGGRIFKSDDADALAKMIEEFALCQDIVLELHGEIAKRIFADNFSENIMQKHMEKILNKILNND